MLQKMNNSDFIKAFLNSKSYRNNFSKENLLELYNHLEDMNEQSNEFIFDILSIVRNYSQLLVEDFIQRYKNIIEKYGYSIPKNKKDHREFLGMLCSEGYFHIINIDKKGNILYKNF